MKMAPLIGFVVRLPSNVCVDVQNSYTESKSNTAYPDISPIQCVIANDRQD